MAIRESLKVLFVSEYWEPHGQGGGEISAAMLAKALANHGVDVHVLTSAFDSESTYERKDNIAVHRKLKTAKSPVGLVNNIIRQVRFPRSVALEVKRLVEHERFDVVHYFNTTAALGAPKTEVPMLVHVNSPVFFCPKGTLMYQDKNECHHDCTPTRFLCCFTKSREFGKTRNKWYLKLNPAIWFLLYRAWRKRAKMLKTFDHITPNSTFMDHKLHDIGIPGDRATVLPNVVILTKKHKINTSSLVTKDEKDDSGKIQKHKLRILYTGTYVESKGVLDLLSALKEITSPYECHLYGGGPLKQQLLEFTTTNGLSTVQIHDPIPHEQLVTLYDEFDIVVQPSLVAEAMPRAVLEALAAGKIVVTSNVGGAKGVVIDGENGILYDPYQPGALKSALERALNDAKLRTKLAKAAPQSVAQFTEAAVAERAIALYRTLLNRKASENAPENTA